MSNMNGKPIQTATHPVPYGIYSMLNAMLTRQISMIAAMVYFVLHYKSNWQTGKTHKLPYRHLAKLLGISPGYALKAIKELEQKGWIKDKDTHLDGNIYHLVHHNCNPENVPRDDKRKKRLTCAMPHGEGSPVEMMFEGKITWKACLYWIVAKRLTSWDSHLPTTLTLKETQKWLKFDDGTLLALQKQLVGAGLLEQVSKPHHTFRAILHPLPPGARAARQKAERKAQTEAPPPRPSYEPPWKKEYEERKKLPLMVPKIIGYLKRNHQQGYLANREKLKAYAKTHGMSPEIEAALAT